MNSKSYVAFIGAFKVAEGNATEVIQHLRGRAHEQPVIIEMETGRQVVFNLASDPYPAAIAGAVAANFAPARSVVRTAKLAGVRTSAVERKPSATPASARSKRAASAGAVAPLTKPAAVVNAVGSAWPAAAFSQTAPRGAAGAGNSATLRGEAAAGNSATPPAHVASLDDAGSRATSPAHAGSLDAASETEPPRFHGRGRGRPRLGVVSRDVTLLPDHWQWLAAQPGGASAAIRRLIDGARKQHVVESRIRSAQEALQRFLSTMAEHLPGYQEAARAVAACDVGSFSTIAANWPLDIAQLAVAQMVRIAAEANRKR